MVFVCSMADLFHRDVPDSVIHEIFDVMNETSHTYQILTKRSKRLAAMADQLTWTPNIWAGVTIENDAYTFRADHLRQVPSAIRFVSFEPLLGPVPSMNYDLISWVIVGGESGPEYRDCDPEWVRQIRDATKGRDLPLFFKQWGGYTPHARGKILDGEQWTEWPTSQHQVSGSEPTLF